jgi:K+-sensing histidine kinase KdpD
MRVISAVHASIAIVTASEQPGEVGGADIAESAGRFRIYLGAAGGVGKTYAMLNEGQRRRGRGADVVVGSPSAMGGR